MRVFTLLAVLTMAGGLAACDAGTTDDGVATISGGLAEGSAEAMGVLHFLNAASTTVTLLDVDVALDARAARALVAHRDGKDGKPGTKDDDPFDTVAEVDAVRYVGASALGRLVSYCVAHGWVPAGSDVLGTFDNVVFTVDEGMATLALANSASVEQLDRDVQLDRRAAANIVAARPIGTMLALSKVAYVGTTALRALKQAAQNAQAPTLPGAEVAKHLAAASADLWHTSESDYPFTIVRVPGAGGAPITAANVKALIAPAYDAHEYGPALAERAVEVRTLASFFDRYTVAEDWWEDEQRAQAPRFQALEDVLRGELIDVQVFRLGERSGGWLEGEVDVYIIGRSVDGELVGVATVSVET